MAEWLAEIFPSLGQSLQDRHHSADLMSPLRIHFEITSYYKRQGQDSLFCNSRIFISMQTRSPLSFSNQWACCRKVILVEFLNSIQVCYVSFLHSSRSDKPHAVFTFLNACLKSLCTEAVSHNVLTFGTGSLFTGFGKMVRFIIN